MVRTFFNAQSIAVIGASQNKEKLGNVIVHNLMAHHYQGKVYPVNPKGGTLYGRKVYADVSDIPYAVDMALIVIPAALVPAAVKACGKQNIRSVIIISAGFSEQDAAGAKRERVILQIAQQYNIRVLGPNCLGMIIPRLKMNASFAAGMPDQGSVAVVSQSGAMAVAITEWALSTHLGFSALVSLGNKADVHEEDLIAHFGRDDRTNVIVLYLESLATGRSLLRTIKRVSKIKPVIILKPGKSLQAQAAVASHTGAIAGAHAVQQSFLEAAGAIVVDSLEELFLYTKLFEEGYRLLEGKVAIITNAGGPGILATDAVVAAEDLTLAELSDATETTLRTALPEVAATANPVDVVGDADMKRYNAALRAVLDDVSVNGVVALLTHQYVTDTKAIARAIIRAQKKYPEKPIAVSFIGGAGLEPARQLLTKANILQFEYPEQAVQALAVLRRYYKNRERARYMPEVKTRSAGRLRMVLGSAAERILKRYVPHLLSSALVRTSSDATRRAQRLGYPVVAKIISKKLVHKTEASAVQVNIPDAETLTTVINEWHETLQIRFGKNEGILLQPYRPGMVEMIIGAKRDPELGPYLVVGLGGIFVEAIGGQQIVPLPCTRRQATDALHQGILGRILTSHRGQRIPEKQVVDIMMGVSDMMLRKPGLQECDCNPVILSADGAAIVDVRLSERR